MFNDNNKSGRMVLEDIEVGVPFYMVHGLGEQSFLTELTPTEEPCVSEFSDSLFVMCEEDSYSSKGKKFARTHSVEDMGIIPNKYNAHQTFFDKESAEEYLALALKLPRKPHTNDFVAMFTTG